MDEGVSDKWGADCDGRGEDADGLSWRSLATSISCSLSLMVRAAGGGSAETSASWCWDGGGTLMEARLVIYRPEQQENWGKRTWVR